MYPITIQAWLPDKQGDSRIFPLSSLTGQAAASPCSPTEIGCRSQTAAPKSSAKEREGAGVEEEELPKETARGNRPLLCCSITSKVTCLAKLAAESNFLTSLSVGITCSLAGSKASSL